MQIQTVLNSDIVMRFNECTPYDVDSYITTSAETHISKKLSQRFPDLI